MIYAGIQFTPSLLRVLLLSCFPFDLAQKISLIYNTEADQELRSLNRMI